MCTFFLKTKATKLSRLITKSVIKFVVLEIRGLQGFFPVRSVDGGGDGVSLNHIILINSDWTGTGGGVTGHKADCKKGMKLEECARNDTAMELFGNLTTKQPIPLGTCGPFQSQQGIAIACASVSR